MEIALREPMACPLYLVVFDVTIHGLHRVTNAYKYSYFFRTWSRCLVLAFRFLSQSVGTTSPSRLAFLASAVSV